jgi:hypothetical protein
MGMSGLGALGMSSGFQYDDRLYTGGVTQRADEAAGMPDSFDIK